jgi:hypothetical protein
MRVPTELEAADHLMNRYGRWAMDRWKARHCGSAEGRYRSPQHWEAQEPKEVLIEDFKAVEVQRVLQQVPMIYRRVMQAEYIPGKVSLAAQKRIMRLSQTTWDGSLIAGLRHFTSIWNRDFPQKKIGWGLHSD